MGIVNLTRSSRPSWPLSVERGAPYRGAKDFSAPNRRATDGQRLPPLHKLTMPAQSLCRGDRPIKPRPVVADDRELVAAPETAGRQTAGERLDLGGDLRPA